MSFVHVVYVGFFDCSSGYLDPHRVTRRLGHEDLAAIEREVAGAFNRVIELGECLTPGGYLAFCCAGPYDWDDPYRVALVASRLLGAVAGERTVLAPEHLRAAVQAIEARGAELKRIRALPTASEQVAAVVTHVKGGRGGALRWPFTLHALRPGRGDTIDALAAALLDEDAAVRAFAAAGLGSLGPAAAPAVTALASATTDRHEDVRHEAAHALGRIGPVARPAIADLLKALESDVKLAWKVTGALEEIGLAAVPALIHLLANRGGPARIQAADCLGKLGPAAVAPSSELERVAAEEQGDRGIWRAARRTWRAINPGVPPPPGTAPRWVKR